MNLNRSGLRAGNRVRRGAALIAALLVSCLLLSAVLTGCGGSSSPIGAWHNEELGQLLRFHDDGTVVIRTPNGDSEATYIYDKDGKQGTITLNGQAIGFTLDGDTLTLTWGGVQTVFAQGDMEVVAAVAEATPVSTPASAGTATPPVETSDEPSNTPDDETSGPELSSGVFPSVSLVPLPTDAPAISLNPHISGIVIPGDIFGNLSDSIVGTWVYTEDSEQKIVFDSEGGCTLIVGSYGVGGTYTYDTSTHTGSITVSVQTSNFSVDGDTLTLQGTSTFVRE